MRRRRGSAFTLVELLAVLLLMALLATGVSLSLKGVLRDAELRNAASQLIQFDRLAREQARRSDRPSQLRFELQAGRVRNIDARTKTVQGRELQLPAGVAIEQVRTARQPRGGADAVVPCSARGQTTSYAVLLRGVGRQQLWLVVAGLSGTVETVRDDQTVNQTFALLAHGHDAR